MATATHEKTNRRTVRPASMIRQDKDAVILQVEMPGVAKDNIDIQVEDDTLTIHGSTVPGNGDEYLVRERRDADFYQTYTLDETIDRERIDAHMEDGVLMVHLQLKEAVKPRKIAIAD
ncbi:MAG: Hsp20/alpha crystallin family protein [Spirochaetaceae bacterium]|nr:MAG: Hsp20/alpha crystallin family protein [Spirochaetaceae bacterium]